MRKLLGILFAFLIVVAGGILSPASGNTLKVGDNVLYFKNFESVFDSTGAYKEPGPANPIIVGDHFFGIISIQNIDAGGTTHWWSGAQDQTTGIFAQEVLQIYNAPNDAFDPAQTTLSHFVLGPPRVSQFTGPDGTTVDISGLLSGDEMIALWRDTGPGTTPFEHNGTFLDDVTKATDGSLWLTVGYADPAGNGRGEPSNAIDDTGYTYSHGPQGVPLQNFKGETYAGLNSIQNLTGMPLSQTLNDPDQSELGGDVPTWLATGDAYLFAGHPWNGLGLPPKFDEMYLSGELESNPYSLARGGTEPWDFLSNDPAYISVEELLEGSCRMTGGGVDVDGEIVLETLATADDTDDKDKYQFGGQVGAPTASQPQPYGEWTHHQQKGPSGSFAFHAGTSSAPEGTEILTVTCSDPGCCSPARPAPFKQIDFDGIGTFKNVKGMLKGIVTPDNQPGVTLHYFRVHVEDIGEPGPGGKQPKSADCTHVPGTPIVVPDDCENCADVYQIEIHLTSDQGSEVIYSVGGFIKAGNLQIHPAIK